MIQLTKDTNTIHTPSHCQFFSRCYLISITSHSIDHYSSISKKCSTDANTDEIANTNTRIQMQNYKYKYSVISSRSQATV